MSIHNTFNAEYPLERGTLIEGGVLQVSDDVGDKDASCFRVGTCRCSGSELVQTMEVAWGSGLAARAQKAAALLAKRGALGRVPGRWDVGVCIAAFGLVACLGVCVSQHSASSPPSDCESRHSAHLPTRILGHILGAQGSCDRSRPRSLSGLTFNARRKTAAH